MNDKPLFSIIVVSYNAEDKIKVTINSVLNQTYPDYEIVVKDGMSKDNTLAQIPSDKRIRVFQNKDSGIYDGMNEAIDHASGELLFFLNCGDLFQNEKVLETVAKYYEEKNRNCEFIYGSIERGDAILELPDSLSNFFMYHGMIFHQAVFFKKDLFEKYGKYNLTYKLAGDYEYMLRAYKNNVKMDKIDLVVCNYEGEGASETVSGTKLGYAERKRVIRKYFSLPERLAFGTIMFLSFRKLRIYAASDRAPKWISSAYQIIRKKTIGIR